jgi:hypothetical protein
VAADNDLSPRAAKALGILRAWGKLCIQCAYWTGLRDCPRGEGYARQPLSITSQRSACASFRPYGR